MMLFVCLFDVSVGCECLSLLLMEHASGALIHFNASKNITSIFVCRYVCAGAKNSYSHSMRNAPQRFPKAGDIFNWETIKE